jgi:hypothetical protein
VAQATAALEREAHAAVLSAMDIDAPQVRVNGQAYRPVLRGPGNYYTMARPVCVERTLYPKLGERSGGVHPDGGAAPTWGARKRSDSGQVWGKRTDEAGISTGLHLDGDPARCKRGFPMYRALWTDATGRHRRAMHYTQPAKLDRVPEFATHGKWDEPTAILQQLLY